MSQRDGMASKHAGSRAARYAGKGATRGLAKTTEGRATRNMQKTTRTGATQEVQKPEPHMKMQTGPKLEPHEMQEQPEPEPHGDMQKRPKPEPPVKLPKLGPGRQTATKTCRRADGRTGEWTRGSAEMGIASWFRPFKTYAAVFHMHVFDFVAFSWPRKVKQNDRIASDS